MSSDQSSSDDRPAEEDPDAALTDVERRGEFGGSSGGKLGEVFQAMEHGSHGETAADGMPFLPRR